MTTAVRVASTHTLPMEAVQGASWVGQIVTVRERQFTVHSVEGADWYAHLQDGQVTVDVNMTPVHIVEPIATVLPMGAKLGQGFAETYEVSRLTRGVCLAKW
jgi:hypothetical protein